MRHLARRCVLLGLCSMVLATPSPAQEAGAPKVEIYPLPRSMFEAVRVAAVEADGTIRLEAVPDSSPFPSAEFPQRTEGHYLLIAPPVRPVGVARDGVRPIDGVVRVEVVEIGAKGSLKAKAEPEAARVLKAGDVVAMIRPAFMTTAAIRSMPAVTPLLKENDPRVPSQVAEGLARTRQMNGLARSMNNLRQIGLALHNFHSANNNFPPAVVYGPDGKPWHSWRVLILGYIEELELFNQYDFTQPWDSPKNRLLLDKMPAVYRDPLSSEKTGSNTHYAVLVGEVAMFSAKGSSFKIVNGAASDGMYRGRSLTEVRDGTSYTIAIAPVDPARKIPWTKPEDIEVGADFPAVGKPGGIFTPARIGGVGLAPVLFADGSAHLLSDQVALATVRALTTIRGREIIDLSKLAPAGIGTGPPPASRCST